MAWSDAARAAALEARRRRLARRLKPGQTARYARPGPGERGIRFTVREAHYDTGGFDRVHAAVQGTRGRIVPVETLRPSDLRAVRPPGRFSDKAELLRQRGRNRKAAARRAVLAARNFGGDSSKVNSKVRAAARRAGRRTPGEN
jgi:hypothetical protein